VTERDQPLNPPPPLPPELTTEPRKPVMPVVLRMVLVLTAVEVVLVAASGMWLALFYEPAASSDQDIAERLHLNASWLLLGTLVAALLAALIPTARAHPVLPVTALACYAIALATGPLLQYDSLGPRSVHVPVPVFRGLRWLVHQPPQVRFAVVDGHHVSLGAFRFWAGAHVGAGLAVAALVFGARWMRTRPFRPSPTKAWVTRP
jgi:hypothetical protein